MILDQLRRARAVGAPLIAISTADQPALIEALASYNGKTAIVSWDIVRGFHALNEGGAAALAIMLRGAGQSSPAVTNLVDALDMAHHLPGDDNGEFPSGSMLVIQNGHSYLRPEIQPVQALMNLRNAYKATRRTILLLGPDFTLPAELTHDVIIIDEPLPSAEAIRAILSDLYSGNGIEPTPADLERCTDALAGLAPFAVETAAALSINPDKSIDFGELWARKIKMVQSIKGLSMERPAEGFEAIGGNGSIKNFFELLAGGRRKPRVIVFVDEIEKSSAVQGQRDTSGTSQDQLQTWLTNMVDQDATGLIGVGPAGTGKTAIARAAAAALGVPLLIVDFNAAKGSLVGQSEQQTRAIWKAISAIAGHGGAFVIATSNSVDDLPPALQSRFWFGTWFFDLPSKEEREAIGAIHARKAGIEDNPTFWASCDGWSGRNIFACAQAAAALNISLEDAARAYIIPAASQDKTVEKLRQQANGAYLSAAYPGKYEASKVVSTIAPIKPRTRKIAELRTEIHEAIQEEGSDETDPPVIEKPQITAEEIEQLAATTKGKGKK